MFCITLPVPVPGVDRDTLWQKLDLHDWMSEEYAHLEEPLLELTGFPCSWTFFHHLRDQIQREFTLHDHLQEKAQDFLRPASGLPAQHWGPPTPHLRGHSRVPWGLSGSDAPSLEGRGGQSRLPPAGHGLVPARHKAPIFGVTSNGMG